MSLHIPPALRHRRFTYLFIGQAISIAGTQMQITAIFWHIRTLTGTPNPLALGGVGLARILPVILFSLLAGPVADAFIGLCERPCNRQSPGRAGRSRLNSDTACHDLRGRPSWSCTSSSSARLK